MSTSINPSRISANPSRLTLPRPRLTVVPRAAGRGRRIPFLVLVVSVLAAGLVGLLVLNTSMERGAYQVTALRKESAALAIRQQTLQLQVSALQNPQHLAEQAVRLGMVQDLSPAFISLGSGHVAGRSVPGRTGDQVRVGSTGGAIVPRLSKVAPLVAGEANSATTGVVHHRGPQSPTKGGDTGPGSTGTGH